MGDFPGALHGDRAYLSCPHGKSVCWLYFMFVDDGR